MHEDAGRDPIWARLLALGGGRGESEAAARLGKLCGLSACTTSSARLWLMLQGESSAQLTTAALLRELRARSETFTFFSPVTRPLASP